MTTTRATTTTTTIIIIIIIIILIIIIIIIIILQKSVLSMRLVNEPDEDVCDTSTARTSFSGSPIPPHELQHIQKVWRSISS